jgi:hypothetical protein
MEYSTPLIACFFSILLAYWPKAQNRHPVPAIAPQIAGF